MRIATATANVDTIIGLFTGLPFGAMAEVGVWHGGTLKLMADRFTDGRIIYGFDTFTGMPMEQMIGSERHLIGWFSDATFESVSSVFSEYANVRLVKGLFPNTITDEHRNERYAMVHLDADIYVPIRSGIECFWPRIVPGGVLVIDDFRCPECPMVEAAIRDSGLEGYTADHYQVIARKQ